MELDTLINENVSKVTKKKCNYNYFYIFVIFISILNIVLTTFCLIYIIVLSNIAKKIHFNSLDIDKETEYIHKLETIIDYICDHYIQC